MGAIRLPDELQHAIDRQVAQGRATSAAAFVEEAVLRLIDDAKAEEAEIVRAAEAGIADAIEGRATSVTTPADGQRLHERLMARLHESLAAGT
jgi:Arc/MetJ-type ribon-helix-helix transcriptional regulator